jgi:short-subunit dehydrogenase
MRRRILVTGASSGIGRATARLLWEGRDSLVLTGRREEALREVAEGTDAEVIAADLTEPEACARVADLAFGGGGGYPVLVNAAGGAEFGPMAETGFDLIEGQMAVNFLAPARLIHRALPIMLERGGGQIVNVLSIAATTPLPGATAYAASKAALHMLGKVLAQEARREGIRVTSLIVGATDTPLWEGKGFVPERADMLPAQAVAEAIRDAINLPHDRNVDEIVLMPPKGVL